MKLRLTFNLAIAVLLVALTAEYNGRALGVVTALEMDAYDWRVRRTSESAAKQDDVVIIDIDRDSLRALGPWPWGRDRFVELSRRLLDQYEVRMIAFALPFSAPDDNAIKTLQNAKKRLNLNPFDSGKLDVIIEEANHDARFEEAVRDKPVVLGYIFDESARAEAALPRPVNFFDKEDATKPAAASILKQSARNWPFRRGYSGNRPELIRGALTAGHLTFFQDDDGLIRRAPLIIRHGGGYYESFPLAVLRHYQNSDKPQPLQVEANTGVSAFQISRFRVPVDKEGAMLLNYAGAGGAGNFEESPDAVFRYISAVDVINGDATAAHLRNKVAVVGSSADQFRDLHATPVNSAMPGAELAALQLANLLNNEGRSRPSGVAETAVLLLVALAAAAGFLFVGPLISFAVTVALSIGWIWFNLGQWDNLSVYRFVPPLFVFAGLFLWSFIIGFIVQWRSSRQMQDTFGQYVPPELAKRMGKEKISMEGESRTISVLFSDVRNFTSISEQYQPKDLAQLMNRMLTTLSAAIHKNGGTVDKYIGDAVMAFWNAPLDDPEHARNATMGALDMQDAMRRLSDQLVAEGRAPMRLGVGICTGEASVGNMGSELRMAYTAMGDTVNLSSRLEGLTKKYGAGILVSESVQKACGNDIAFRWVDDVRVKGRERPVRIFEPIGEAEMILPEVLRAIEEFHQMRRLYGKGDFSGAKASLDKYMDAIPDDPVGAVYLRRLESLISNPPSEWDGVTKFEEK